MPQRWRPTALAVLCALAAGAAPVLDTVLDAVLDTAPARAASAQRGALPRTGCPRAVAPGHVACFAEVGRPLGGTWAARTAARTGLRGGTLRAKTGEYTPRDLAALYRIPSHVSTTATIGIIEVGHDPDAAKQLAHYRRAFGLPSCTTSNGCFREVAQDGSDRLPPTDDAWTSEIAIDLQAVSAICPSCHLLLVDAADDRMRNTLHAAATAVEEGARYVSMSFGGREDATTTSLARTYLSHPGVTYVAATGDDGYSSTAMAPAAAPNVVAVGGTSVTLRDGRWHQTAWSGTGAGCARLQVQPVAQTLAPPAVSACGGRRALSDVAALADVDTGMLGYLDGGWYEVGGTSLATPIITALYAIAGNHTEPMSIYRRATESAGSFVDITAGSAGSCAPATVCSAGPGWDGPTGLGTPAGPAALAVADSAALTYDAATAGALTATGGWPRALRYRLRERVTRMPVRGAEVTLQRRTDGRWRSVTRRRTNAIGAVRLAVRPHREATYRVVFRGDATHQPSRSRRVRVGPPPRRAHEGSEAEPRRSGRGYGGVSSWGPPGAAKLLYLIYELT